MSLNSITPIADLHTPEELLDNAEVLFSSNNPKMMRAAVLEAITALEAHVQAVVFPYLNTKLDSSFVEWLKEKTKMDFEARLSVLTPVAMGRPIDKQSILWADYKKAKAIRNKVTHSGTKVSPVDARFVIDTVYKWLGYISGTLDIELALMELKRYIEDNKIQIALESEGLKIIADYFGKTKAATTSQEVGISFGNRRLLIDLVIKLGFSTTIIETKFFRKFESEQRINSAIEQVKSYLVATDITQAAVIIFQQGDSLELNQGLSKYDVSISKDKQSVIYVLFIKV